MSDEFSEFLPAVSAARSSEPSPLGRRLAYVMCALLLVVGTVIAIAEVDCISTAPGRLIPAGKSRFVFAPEQTMIRKILVVEGQKVRAGQALAELDSRTAQLLLDEARERSGLLESEIRRIEAEARASGEIDQARGGSDVREGTLLAMRTESRNARIAEAHSDIRQRTHLLEGVVAEQQRLQEELPRLTERATRLRPYVGEAISEDDFFRLEQQVANTAAALKSAVARAKEAEASVRGAEVRMKQLRLAGAIEGGTMLREKYDALSALKTSIARSVRSIQLSTVVAPIDGVVQSVAVDTVGAPVGPNQPLLTLVPSTSRLEIDAELAATDIAYVAQGQEVEVRVDSFPFQRYGMLSGRVTLIGTEADSGMQPRPGALAPEFTTGQATGRFSVRIALDADQHNKNIDLARLRPGTGVQADIKTERSRLLTLLYSPLLGIVAESRKLR